MINVNRHWYHPSLTWFSLLLLPLSWFFQLIVKVRFKLYQLGIKKKYAFAVPIIVVGNITAGGTGKTPFVIWLAHYLKEQGYKPGIVSRGYGAKEISIVPSMINAASNPAAVGDEAVLLAKRSGSPVMIAANRVAAVDALINQTHCNIIISDDGLQHYRLSRHIEIAMVDGERRFGNQRFLPAGPLRESIARLQKVDFVVTQRKALANEYEMNLCGDQLINLKSAKQRKSLQDFKDKKIHAVAAIGNPKRFFANLRCAGIEIIEHVFPDHYLFQKSDFDFGDDLPVVMTEKDAVKCRSFAASHFWYLPVDAKLAEGFEQALLRKLNELKVRK